MPRASTCWAGRSAPRWPRSGLPRSRRRSRGWCCTAAGPRATRSATRTADGTCSGCWRPTGAWDLTCSPTSSLPRRTPEPAVPWLSTSARPPRPRRRSRCLAWRTTSTCCPALARITAPTLVLHRRGDRAAPADQSRALAEAIPDAELVELEGRSHLPAMGDAQAVVDQVRRFLGLPRLRRAVPTSLTPRQTEVAALVADGLTNRELAERLGHQRTVGRVAPGADPATPRVQVALPGRRLVRRARAAQVR